jgi:hypothetical protein
MLHWQDHAYRAAATSGVALGLAALTHPFALVFAIQLGIWTLARCNSGSVRLISLVVLILATTSTFALWLPLIAIAPNLFWSQFAENILRPAGPGLLSRLVMPSASIANQIPQLMVRANLIQFSMLVLGLIMTSGFVAIKRDRSARLGLFLAVSSIYLLIVCVGIHPIQGFWCYPAALCWLCFAYASVSIADSWPAKKWITPLASLALIFAMIPGSGLRATWTYLKNQGDTNFSSRPFVKQILREVPDEATLTVGREFALDAYGSGREIILACRHPMYFDSAKWPTDFFIFGRRDSEERMVEGYQSMGHRLERIKQYGDPEDPLCNYAELWSLKH